MTIEVTMKNGDVQTFKNARALNRFKDIIQVIKSNRRSALFTPNEVKTAYYK